MTFRIGLTRDADFAAMALQTIYAFHVGADGSNPRSFLIQGSTGSLYGTTAARGAYGWRNRLSHHQWRQDDSHLFVTATQSISMSNGPVHSGTQKKIRAGGFLGK